MRTIDLKTNIHCQSCVDEVKPKLDSEQSISKWQVDTKSADKILHVEGKNINNEDVIQLVRKSGYEATPFSETLQLEKWKAFWSEKHKWKRASFNTLNCLIGCSIGDFGMIIFLQAYYPQTSLMWQMILAVIAGLCTSIALETVILKVRESFQWKGAFTTALSMSFMSMIAMEIAMNITDFAITGGKAAFDDPMYWIALGIAAIAGFLTPLPYNYYKLKKFNKACH